jgi:hypothetical protein
MLVEVCAHFESITPHFASAYRFVYPGATRGLGQFS